jgi:hypothetical protein
MAEIPAKLRHGEISGEALAFRQSILPFELPNMKPSMTERKSRTRFWG